MIACFSKMFVPEDNQYKLKSLNVHALYLVYNSMLDEPWLNYRDCRDCPSWASSESGTCRLFLEALLWHGNRTIVCVAECTGLSSGSIHTQTHPCNIIDDKLQYIWLLVWLEIRSRFYIFIFNFGNHERAYDNWYYVFQNVCELFDCLPNFLSSVVQGTYTLLAWRRFPHSNLDSNIRLGQWPSGTRGACASLLLLSLSNTIWAPRHRHWYAVTWFSTVLLVRSAKTI